MTLSEVAKHRFFQQQLAGTDIRDAVEMVAWFGAIQGQEYAQSRWSLGLRVPGLKDSDVEKDFNEGRILRTHLLRPTWHLVTAQDIHWLLALTGPRVHQANAFSYRRYELDEAIFNRSQDIIIKALEGGKQLTRNELNTRFKAAGIKAESSRLSYILMKAELDGLICSGPRRGKQFTYALLEERAGKRETNQEEALAELTKRYFRSRGPATLNDFSTWSGLTLTQCRQGVDMHKPLLTSERIQNRDFYFFPEALTRREPSENVHLLPIYDEYIMGYKNREAVFLEYKDIVPQAHAIPLGNTIAFKGQIIGIWKREVKGKSMEVGFGLFGTFHERSAELLEAAAKRLEMFTGLKVNIYQ